MKILSTCYHDEFPLWILPDSAVDELRHAFPDFQIVKLTSRERVLEELADTDILLAWAVSPEQIAAAPRLKWIHAGMAGLNWILIPEVIESDIVVSSSKGVHAIPIAEHTMALMLQFSRRLARCVEDQRSAVWRRRQLWEASTTLQELHGKTVCIVGIGTLGSEIARRAHAFGMKVIGVRKNTNQTSEGVDVLYPPEMLDQILPSVDYLIIAVPVTEDTKGMIGRRQFDRMKRSAFLVNIARGEIVDQEALIEALNNDRIAGAGLDVFVPDPLPDGHPLFSTRNLIITPHVSGISPMLWRRVMDLWIDNIHRFLAGKPLINQVDKRKGY